MGLSADITGVYDGALIGFGVICAPSMTLAIRLKTPEHADN